MTKKRLLLIVAVALIVLALKKASEIDQSEWEGLTEDEARSKLDTKLPSRIPEEARAEISNKIVGAMRDKGVIREAEDVVDLRGTTSDTAEAEEAAQN